jgi:hypothetical protein
MAPTNFGRQMTSNVHSAAATQSLMTLMSRTTGNRRGAPDRGAPRSTGNALSLVILSLTVGSSQPQLFDVNGETYVAATAELEGSGQTRPRLVVAQSLSQPRATFATSRWMLCIPPVLVIIAVLFALTAGRRVAVVRQH